MMLLALAVGALSGRNPFALADRPLFALALGALTAAATLSISLLAYRLVPALRSLADELGPELVDRARVRDLALLAVLSGVGEEALFRGALQPLVGLVVASLLFGLVHIGPDRRYLAWTASAIVAGFVLGILYEATGGILAPAVAHALHNGSLLVLWKRSRGSLKGGGAP
jgi:membrane protease YdiL (CAAX protease family)